MIVHRDVSWLHVRTSVRFDRVRAQHARVRRSTVLPCHAHRPRPAPTYERTCTCTYVQWHGHSLMGRNAACTYSTYSARPGTGDIHPSVDRNGIAAGLILPVRAWLPGPGQGPPPGRHDIGRHVRSRPAARACMHACVDSARTSQPAARSFISRRSMCQ